MDVTPDPDIDSFSVSFLVNRPNLVYYAISQILEKTHYLICTNHTLVNIHLIKTGTGVDLNAKLVPPLRVSEIPTLQAELTNLGGNSTLNNFTVNTVEPKNN